MSSFKLDGGEHAQRRVPTLAVMKGLKVLEDSIGKLDPSPLAKSDPLLLSKSDPGKICDPA